MIKGTMARLSLFQRVALVTLASAVAINIIVFMGVRKLHRMTHDRDEVISRVFQNVSERMVSAFMASDHSVQAARGIFEHEGIPFIARSGPIIVASDVKLSWLASYLDTHFASQKYTSQSLHSDRGHIFYATAQNWQFAYAPFGHSTPRYYLLFQFAMILVASVSVSVLNYFIIRRMLAPLETLKSGVDAVSAGDLSVRLKVESQNELGRLASAFNKMCDHVSQLIAEKERLLVDVSHDLRSPLARIRVATELAEPTKYTASITSDVEILDHLIESILNRWKAAKFDNRADMRTTDLVSTIENTIRSEFPKVTLNITSIPNSVRIKADPEQINTLIRNLLDNAYKYGRTDSRQPDVVVNLNPNNTLEINVSDAGIGIAKEHLDRVTEAFFRSDSARNPNQMGFGLGLNICERIVLNHQGKISIESELGNGTKVTVVLPTLANS